MYMPSYPLGLRDKSFQGDAYYSAPNPPFGAVFTYYLKEELKGREARRKESEQEAEDAGEAYRYPSWDELRAEEREQEPTMLLVVTDDDGNVVRRITGPTAKGIHRVAWDLRYPPSEPTSLAPPSTDNPFSEPPQGPMVAPGTYHVTLYRQVDGEPIRLAQARTVETVPLGNATLAASDREALLAFQHKVARLQRAVLGAGRVAREAQERIDHLRRAATDTPGAPDDVAARLLALEHRLQDLLVELEGDRTLRSRNAPEGPSINERVQRIVGAQWSSTSPPTRTNREAYRYAGAAFEKVLAGLRGLIGEDLAALEQELERAGAPWTPGRLPTWRME
jgi:hypothetical protein